MPGNKTMVVLDGRRMSLTNLDKVLYPQTGTTKAEVINYYATVGAVMLPHVTGRPVTRKRWPNGVDTEPFFQKNVDQATPDWMPTRQIEHKLNAIRYPLADSVAALAWFGQNGALELHVPQWRFTQDGPGHPDRMVFDLDPGPDTTLADCATVARWVREILHDIGIDAVPVTSGSKGLHLYVGLDGERSSAEVSVVAQQVAQLIETDHPDLVTSKMSKALRPRKVFIDWSQNNGNKTTIGPYSLRGRDRPTVAAPRTWDELDDPELRHLELGEVLERAATADPMVGLEFPGAGASPPAAGAAPSATAEPARDRLEVYRSMRSADRTPEPVPAPGPQRAGADSIFVIQEHHASRLHWDLRLERDGVLVSWAVPRGVPETSGENRLAVHTEDHPMEYATFSGSIPRGEYGGGEMRIWDAGTYETEKWWSKEIIVRLAGTRARGRYVLVQTDGKNWLLHRMKDQTGRWVEHPEPPSRTGAGRRRPPPSSPAAGPASVPPSASASASASALPSKSSSTAGSASALPSKSSSAAGSAPGGSKPVPAATVPNVTALPEPVGRPVAVGSLPAPPTDLQPMLATAGTLLDVGLADGWRFEGKWDGIRAVAEVGGGGLRLTSRTGRDITGGYPELAELVDLTGGHSMVLDGEIVALDPDGRTDFGRLQQRMGLSKPVDVRRVSRQVTVRYWVFDLLWLDGVSLLGKTYDDRRRLLEALGPVGRYCSVPDQLPGPAQDALDVSAAARWEGILAKKADGIYRPGQRARGWIKIKNSLIQEGIIVGWKPGEGRRAGTLGSLLLAVNEPGGLVYIGKVGTGFSDAVLDELKDRLAPLRATTSPVTGPVPSAEARNAVWVRPELVGEVRFAEWTGDGRLRHPSWRGLRPDKRPAEVRRET